MYYLSHLSCFMNCFIIVLLDNVAALSEQNRTCLKFKTFATFINCNICLQIKSIVHFCGFMNCCFKILSYMCIH